jgi:uncharacterized SAM-binding protein YcdF (DUF218 family)
METAGFFVKKALSGCLYPVGLALALLIAGILTAGARRRAGLFLTVAGAAVLAFFSFPPVGHFMLKSLEDKAGTHCDAERLRNSGIMAVAVLGSDLVMDEGPPSECLGDSVPRVLEAVRLWKALPNVRLIISGGSSPTLSSSPDAIRAFCVEAGVDADALTIETGAWDTEDEARLLRRHLGGVPFALVTAAAHLRRSMAIFRNYGLDPEPCPCAFRTRRPLSPHQWIIPGPQALLDAQRALHEYMGLAWLRMKTLRVPRGAIISGGQEKHGGL